jgi:hypothetical protein
MFTVSKFRRGLLPWALVTLRAESDMALSKDRLRLNWLGAPAIDTRVLEVKAGETFTISGPEFEFCVGERVPLDRVAHKLPISWRWRTITTA